MAEGKLLVLGTILKLDRPFKPSHVVDMTGLDRQLVHYHLQAFTDHGYLEKTNKAQYTIRDKEGLLNSLLESAESGGVAKVRSKGFFSEDNVNKFNSQAEMIVAARTLNLPMSQEGKTGYLQKIDDSISVLRALRKSVSNSTKTFGSACKFLKQEDAIESVWILLTQHGGSGLDLPEFAKATETAMTEEEIDM